MALLAPDPRPAVGPDGAQGALDAPPRVVQVDRLGRVQLDPTQVLGADEAVLVRTHEPRRRTVLGSQGLTVEPVGDQHAVGQGVLDRDDGAVAVQTDEDEEAHACVLGEAGSISSR